MQYSPAKSSDLEMLPENWHVCSLCSITDVKKLVKHSQEMLCICLGKNS